MLIRTIIALLLFGAGVFTGWWIATHQEHTVPPEHLGSASSDVEKIKSQDSGTASDSIWLTVEQDEKTQLVPAAILKGKNLIIASLYSVYPANQVYWRDNLTGKPVFAEVIAAHHQSRLIAFRFDSASENGLTLTNETGTLHLGREVLVSLPDRTLKAQVEGALQRDTEGTESYRMSISDKNLPTGASLLDPETGHLIGHMFWQSRTWTNKNIRIPFAVDATAIHQLLDEHQLPAAMSMTTFRDYWEQTDVGLRQSINKLAQLRRWDHAHDKARELWNKMSDYRDRDKELLTTTGFNFARDLIGQRRSQDALAVINNLEPQFPGDAPWCLLKANAYELQNQFLQAIGQAELCLSRLPDNRSNWEPFFTDEQLEVGGFNTLDDALQLQLLELALTLAADDRTPRTNKISTLQQLLKSLPHADLHRVLGDLQYDQQNYAQARFHYQKAVSMNPDLKAELGNRLQNSTQRAQTAPLAEVPFEQRRGAVIVSARLNDSPHTFRFLVDTGATYSAVSAATLLKLGLNDVFNQGAPLIELESAAGPIYAQRFDLGSIQLGAARVDNVPVVILENLEGVDGLIGLSYLRHFDVNLDQQAGKLILTRN